MTEKPYRDVDKYPECNKLSACRPKSQMIGEFLDWLNQNGRMICEYGTAYTMGEGWYPTDRRVEDLLAEYFEIDMDKVEEERCAMLEELRAANEEQDKSAP